MKPGKAVYMSRVLVIQLFRSLGRIKDNQLNALVVMSLGMILPQLRGMKRA
jgi:hypothetical protein